MTEDITLNRQQKDMATSLDQNLLVVAGAGSGKTLTMVKRYDNILEEKDVEPENILLTTFGKEASEEIKERVSVDAEKHKLNIGTLHSLCRRIIREDYKETQFKEKPSTKTGYWLRQFASDVVKDSIAEEYDQRTANNDNLVEDTVHVALKNIDRHRRQLVYPEDAEGTMEVLTEDDKRKISSFRKVKTVIENQLPEMYENYLQKMRDEGTMDYGQMLFETYELLRDNEKIRQEYINQYEYIMVDEAQDLNKLQNKIIDFIADGERLALIGDSSQCLPSDEEVEILRHGQYQTIKIKDVEVGDRILSAKASAEYDHEEVTQKMEKQFDGDLYKFTTKSGKKIRVTGDHEMFARVPSPTYSDWHEDNKQKFYTYLMKANDGRWRIGSTKNLSVRLQIESFARGIIPIETYDSKEEALYHETLYSTQYGIPQCVFTNRLPDDKTTSMKKKWRDKLYQNLECNVEQLAKDKDIDLETFVDVKKATTQGRVNSLNINVRMNTREQSKSMAHRLSVETINQDYQEKIDEVDDLRQDTGRKDGVLRWRKWNQDLDYIRSLAKKIQKNTGGYIVEKFNPVKGRKNALVIPARNVVEGMMFPVKKDGEIQFEEIIKREKEEYTGKVYDLEVDSTNNFGNSQGIFVHNCIYSFRGANNQLIYDFKEEYDASFIIMNKNYRSYQEIVDVGNRVNDQLKDVTNKNMMAVRGKSNEAPRVKAMTPKDVATEIARLIQEEGYPPHEVAILSRTNRELYDYQKELERLTIPTRNAGKDNFMDMYDITKAYGYVRGAVKRDGKAMENILDNRNVYNIDAIKKHVPDDENLFTFIEDLMLDNDYINKGKMKKIRHDIDFVDKLDEDEVFPRLRETKFKKSRTTNLDVLEDLYNSLSQPAFFDYVEKEREDSVTVSTVHQAKGKEWDVVFVVDVNEDKFPREDEEEEKRIFYVAVTRPADKLYVTYSDEPSEFVGWVAGKQKVAK